MTAYSCAMQQTSRMDVKAINSESHAKKTIMSEYRMFCFTS